MVYWAQSVMETVWQAAAFLTFVKGLLGIPDVQPSHAPPPALTAEPLGEYAQLPTPKPVIQTAGSFSTSAGDIFARIRACESHGNYSTNTGNGYYGAYQYNDQTWGGYGGYQHASDAPPSVQDQKARETYAQRGGSPWPVCSRR